MKREGGGATEKLAEQNIDGFGDGGEREELSKSSHPRKKSSSFFLIMALGVVIVALIALFKMFPVVDIVIHFLDYKEYENTNYGFSLSEIEKTEMNYMYTISSEIVTDSSYAKPVTISTTIETPINVSLKQYFGELLVVKMVMKSPEVEYGTSTEKNGRTFSNTESFGSLYGKFLNEIKTTIYLDKFGNVIKSRSSVDLKGELGEKMEEEMNKELEKLNGNYDGLVFSLPKDLSNEEGREETLNSEFLFKSILGGGDFSMNLTPLTISDSSIALDFDAKFAINGIQSATKGTMTFLKSSPFVSSMEGVIVAKGGNKKSGTIEIKGTYSFKEVE